MSVYEMADRGMRRHVPSRMRVAQEINNTGFHEMICDLYKANFSTTQITYKINTIAGKKIISAPSVSAALEKCCVKVRKTTVVGKTTPRRRRQKEVFSGVKKCARCNTKFEKNDVNWMLCPQCYKFAPTHNERTVII